MYGKNKLYTDQNNMDISTTPDLYTPCVDDSGNYIDSKLVIITNGIKCPCSLNTAKIYENKKSFTNHMKTKRHQQWLEYMNNNKCNYYVENIRNLEIIKNQQFIIQRLENELTKLSIKKYS